MLTKKVLGEFENQKFEVVNTWFGGLKLFHNDELIEHNRDLVSVSKNKPIITKKIMIHNVEKTLEVFVYAVYRVKIQIKIDGEKIAGDSF